MDSGRKHPVHHAPHERHNQPVIVFVTVCSKDRKKIFATRQVHELLLDCWSRTDTWLVGRYVVMPDHIHLFCAPGNSSRSVSLQRWVTYWKALATLAWPVPGDEPVWQRHFWDSQLRRDESYDAKWDYVVQNPVRAGLVEGVGDWGYQGECNVLRW